MYATIELDKLSVRCRRYMAENLPIRRKTPSIQSITQSINQSINQSIGCIPSTFPNLSKCCCPTPTPQLPFPYPKLPETSHV